LHPGELARIVAVSNKAVAGKMLTALIRPPGITQRARAFLSDGTAVTAIEPGTKGTKRSGQTLPDPQERHVLPIRKPAPTPHPQMPFAR
jgi:hypothetical protein